MTIAEKIRSARSAAGLSRSAVARRMEVAEYTVHRWETGRALPSVPLLVKLAGALGVSVSSLVEEQPE